MARMLFKLRKHIQLWQFLSNRLMVIDLIYKNFADKNYKKYIEEGCSGLLNILLVGVNYIE
ncbi:hypothetical protein KDK_71220 [Dictyobacter kobayashii]|uniref:Uncharacterized protein n=1 Tax=Dictyobacter kobayashii TaxID=2014872 RepID=A0A402AW26_9CHLR|nr:hypothetical protein KDK_71220 [Dictyobacter kobayashii]